MQQNTVYAKLVNGDLGLIEIIDINDPSELEEIEKDVNYHKHIMFDISGEVDTIVLFVTSNLTLAERITHSSFAASVISLRKGRKKK